MSEETNMNRLWNCRNPHQGDFKKVLCVCSAGLLRSPSTALVLSKAPYNYNTRACGLDKGHALIPIDEVLLKWADEVVCMTVEQQDQLLGMVRKDCAVICLKIPDIYGYRDPRLMKLIKTNYNAAKAKLKEDENS